MDGNDILRLGYPSGKVIGLALRAAEAARAEGVTDEDVLGDLAAVLNAPDSFLDDPVYGRVAEALAGYQRHRERASGYDLTHAAPYKVWGAEGIEEGALEQMKRAVRLPVAVRGALMPDAHQGYGLPIGGVLATDNSVIPYAVGVDIACRMRMTVFNASPRILNEQREHFRQVLETQTSFGAGSEWNPPREHEVMDDPLWREHPRARQYYDIAVRQLGTSGSGNHFVELGALTVYQTIETPSGKIPPGTYLAALSHSGSRRFGLEMAEYYTKVAMQQRVGLPQDFKHLAWLGLDEEAGQEYWHAMHLAGQFASANHHVIHERVARAAGLTPLAAIENHHNFAWREVVQLDGEKREAIVHRKGATPAGKGVLGIIPGTMADTGYLVAGKGEPKSLNSASHGGGRAMSRRQAKKTISPQEQKQYLKEHGVTLIGGGLDEAPQAYKRIQDVIQAQHDLVDILGTFQPRLVRMASDDPPWKRKAAPTGVVDAEGD